MSESAPSDPTGSGSAQGNDVEDAAGGKGGVHVKAKAVRRMFEAQERTADVLEKLLMSIDRMATPTQLEITPQQLQQLQQQVQQLSSPAGMMTPMRGYVNAPPYIPAGSSRNQQVHYSATGANRIPLGNGNTHAGSAGNGQASNNNANSFWNSDAPTDAARIEALQNELEHARRQLASMQVTREHSSNSSSSWTPKPKRPDSFDGDADKVQAFVRALDRWFAHYEMSEADKVRFCTECLTEAAQTWYDAKERVAELQGRPPFATVSDFKAALKEHFLLAGRWSTFRGKLAYHRQRYKTLGEYNREFLEIISEIPDVTLSETCFYYVHGLSRSLRPYVRQMPVWTALEANPTAATASTFDALKAAASQAAAASAEDYAGADRRGSTLSGKRKAEKVEAVNNLREIVAKLSPQERKRRRDERRCYICGDKHLARDCPQWKPTVNALFDGWDDEDLHYVFNITEEQPPPASVPDEMTVKQMEEMLEEGDFDTSDDEN